MVTPSKMATYHLKPMRTEASQLFWLPGDWRPHPEEKPFVEHLIQHFNRRYKLKLRDYWDLHTFSINNQEQFWGDLWSYLGIIGDRGSGPALRPRPLDEPQEWFPDAKLCYAENLLLGHPNALSDRPALICTSEPQQAGTPSCIIGTYSWKELYGITITVANALHALGVRQGDRVASYSASNAEILIGFLAANSLGATYCSCPSEFGPISVIDRFSQFKPKVVFSIDKTQYNGKQINVLPSLKEVVDQIPSIQHVILVGHLEPDRVPQFNKSDFPQCATVTSWQDVVEFGKHHPRSHPFLRLPFQNPMLVVFTSGTTGRPKAIIHGAGGLLIVRKLVAMVNLNLDHRDVCLQFTTTGWIMYNISIGFMTNGCTLVTYDGSPFAPIGAMFDLIEKFKVNYFGTSPRYFQTLEKARYYPNEQVKLDSLTVIAITGAPVTPDVYNFVADRVKHTYLFNASGGTEMCSSFVSSCPTLPLYKSEIQAPTIGIATEALLPSLSFARDEPGALVVTRSFPCMPLGLLEDPQRARFKEEYFSDFSVPVWSQKDSIVIRSLTGGINLLGRSDGILNPGGVRFGSSEIYQVVESLPELFDDAICVGQRHEQQDERVVLFLKMKNGEQLSPEAKETLKNRIRQQLSVRHIPAIMVAVSAVPVTNNGKKAETYVKKLINGMRLEKLNTSALANPECLSEYSLHPEVMQAGHVKAKL